MADDSKSRAMPGLSPIEAEYRLWAEHSGAMVSRHGPDGTVLFVSAACRSILGYEPEEVVGRKLREFLHRDTAAMLIMTQGRIPERDTPVTEMLRMRRRDGTFAWLETTGLKIDVPGEPSPQFISMSRDVSDRKEVEGRLRAADESRRHSEEVLSSVVHHAPFAISYLDREGRVIYVNRYCEELLGYSRDDFANRDALAEAYPDPEYRRSICQSAMNPGPAPRDVRIRTKDGRELEISWWGVRLSDGSSIGMGIDITTRKSAEAKAREMEERTRRLNEALVEAHQRKDEFLAVLAHELRNPLAPIVNAVDAVSRHDVADPSVAKALALVGEKARHLVRLVDDLLDVSRITRGVIHIRPESIDLADVVSQAVTTSRPSLEQRGHRFEIEIEGGPLRVRGDLVRLVQVLANLLNNAAKFTSPGGIIRLTARRVGGSVEIRVIDDGIGIAAEDLPRVFDLFFQSHRPEGAMGIGLALVRSIVELHGGNVEARSAGPGAGSEFVVTLPLLAQDASDTGEPTAVASPSAPRPLPTHRVLVVDDDHAVADGLAMLLDSLGQRVLVAHDGASALDLVTEFGPDLVFIDLSMPGMDGYETARRMSALPGAEARRVIALTGYGLATVESRVREAGFDLYLAKPAGIDDLERVLS